MKLIKATSHKPSWRYSGFDTVRMWVYGLLNHGSTFNYRDYSLRILPCERSV